MNVYSHVGVGMPLSQLLRGKEIGSPPKASERDAGGNGVAFVSAGRPDHLDLRVRWGNEEVKNGNGLIWDTAEEMTELTPEACHILFSAPMSPRLEMM